jgi:hypothetical protein
VIGSKVQNFLTPGLVGLRRNLVPGLVLQTCALAILIGYAWLPAFHTLLDSVGALKTRYGYAYSALSTALFGGFIPFVYLFATKQLHKGVLLAELVFYLGFWVWKGVEVDALYRVQSSVFGNNMSLGTVAAKVCVDQFAYNPLWAAPTQVVFFLWKDAAFSWSGLILQLEQESIWHRVVVVLFSTWMVWLPTAAIVYSLPTALQLPISNLVLCFWCLLLSFISRRTTSECQVRVAACTRPI